MIDWIPAYMVFVALCFGLIVGSFLNVVIHRLPLGLSVAMPPSHCPACQTPIRPYDNIPVVSYLILRARCRHCGTHISARYPSIELLTGVLFAVIAYRFGATPISLLYMIFSAGLIAASMIDIDHQIIPDEISLGGLGLALIAFPAEGIWSGIPASSAIGSSILGALVGGGSLWLVAFVHARLSVAMGREFDHWPGDGEALPTPREADYWLWFPGLGLGDVKLLAMIGAVLGPWGVLNTILMASVIGLLMGIGWALVKGNWDSPFGFGPAIGLGAILAMFLPRHAISLMF